LKFDSVGKLCLSSTGVKVVVPVQAMSSVLENAYLRHRLRQMDQLYPEPSTFGQCDCTSYSYFALSVVLFAVGTVITVLALGDADGYIFSSLGHMWLVGPIFICSGLMVAVKSVLYLRRKGIIQMLLRQRALLRVGFYIPLYHFECISFSFVLTCS